MSFRSDWRPATSPSAVRPVDEPFGHELKAEWLRSSRSGPNGSAESEGAVFSWLIRGGNRSSTEGGECRRGQNFTRLRWVPRR
jgi:hypothetical protein